MRKNLDWSRNARKMSISYPFSKIFKIFHSLKEISISVKIFENFNFNENFRKSRFQLQLTKNPYFRKKNAFEESRFKSKFWKTSITVIMFEKSQFHINFQKKWKKSRFFFSKSPKNLVFIQNFYLRLLIMFEKCQWYLNFQKFQKLDKTVLVKLF